MDTAAVKFSIIGADNEKQFWFYFAIGIVHNSLWPVGYAICRKDHTSYYMAIGADKMIKAKCARVKVS